MKTVVIVAVIVVIVSGLVIWKYLEKQKFDALSPEVQQALTLTKDRKKSYKRKAKEYDQRVKVAQLTLDALKDQKGRRLKNVGGVVLFERWIETPQGSGSIIGVKATAADESSIKQRLTATRIVALGVFALAAPKKSGGGNAYVVVDGPKVSGVATISGKSNTNAGPDAFAFAAAVNNAARAEEIAASTRPRDIESASKALTQASDNADLMREKDLYSAAIDALPAELAQSFARP
ncbi:hypothetical protein ACMTN4_08350 [Rhodococcus globerulus]|uniref:hypothetical protein n=1 Tax=Rhodococcus globerulus TaxID=33008 RepID=UPI0039E866B7